MVDFIDELKWRGLIHDSTPGLQEYLKDSQRTAYIGFDPTSDSLHIGSLVPIILLAHFQKSGHQPIALVGGENGIRKQLSRFLSFDEKFPNHAMIKNNYDWMKEFSFLDFIRDIGKHITVNYMMSKDSVKNRIDSESGSGMSFTEFTYQLVQGYDFLFLNRNFNCSIQMGGSDQWGNITTGMELIRRIDNGKGYALTCPLMTKSDGSKFGKSEGGNIWLDAKKTSAYKFYQYWLNSSDEDAKNYIKIFTFLEKDEIERIISQHDKEPHQRMLHKQNELENAEKASKVLFSKNFLQEINEIDENIFLDIFDGVPMSEISLKEFKDGIQIVKLEGL